MSKSIEPNHITIKMGAGVHLLTIPESGFELDLRQATRQQKEFTGKQLSAALGLPARQLAPMKTTKEGNQRGKHSHRGKTPSPRPDNPQQPRGGAGSGLRDDPHVDAPKRKSRKRRPPRSISAPRQDP